MLKPNECSKRATSIEQKCSFSVQGKNNPLRQTTETVQSSSPLSFCLSVSHYDCRIITLSPSAPPDCRINAIGSLSRGSSSSSPRLTAPERVLCFYRKLASIKRQSCLVGVGLNPHSPATFIRTDC